MKHVLLSQILIENNINWPADAHYAYQSLLDSEVYFLGANAFDVIKRTRGNPLPLATTRGRDRMISRADYHDQIAANRFFDKVMNAGGITKLKNEEREKAIKRIENGLRKDFDIDSPSLAREMFNKGWRR